MVEIVERVTVTISRKWLSETNNLEFDYTEFRKKLNVKPDVSYSRNGENQHVLSGSYNDIKIIKDALEKELNELQRDRKKDLSKNQVKNDVTNANSDILNRPDNEKQRNSAEKTKELHSNEDEKHLQANAPNDATADNSKSEISITPKTEHKNRKEEYDESMDRQNAKVAGPKVDAKECLQFQPTLQNNLVISENNSNPQGVILENTKQVETSSTFLIKHGENIDVLQAGLQVSVGQTKANIVWLKADRMCIVTGSLNDVERVGKIFMECFGDCFYFPDSESNQKYKIPDNEKQRNSAVKTEELHSNEDGNFLKANTTNDETVANSKSEIPIIPKTEHKNRREEYDESMDRQNAKVAGPKVDAKECLQFQPTLQNNLVTSENNSNPQGVILENTEQDETSSTFLIKHGENIDVLQAGLQVSVGQTKANIVWLKADRMCIVTGSVDEVERVGKIFMECFGDCLYFPDSESNQKYRKESNPMKENVSETSSTFFIKHDVDMNMLERGLQVAVGQTKANITWCKEDRMCVVTGSPNEVREVGKIFRESFGDCLLGVGSPVRGHDSKPFSNKANAESKNQTITTIEHTHSQSTPTTPNPHLKSIPMPVIPFVITTDTRSKLEFKSTGMNLTVHVYKSDIVKQITDIIVNSTDCYLMNKERLSRAILQAAGHGVEKECQNLRTQYGSIPPGGSTFTSAGNLRPIIQHIIHAIGPDHEHAMRNKQQAQKCLLEMFKHCLFVTLPLIPTNNRTISFPPVGSRLIGTTDAVRAAFAAIQSFHEHWSKVPRHQRTTLTDIHFVSIDQTEIEDSIVTFRSLIAV